MKRKSDAPPRDLTEVGAGDYVLVGTSWKRIRWNTAEGMTRIPQQFVVYTEDGGQYWDDLYYAKAEDMLP